MRYHLSALMLLFAAYPLLPAPAPVQEQAVMVWGKAADLYANQRRARQLRAGTIVRAVPVAGTRAEWFDVRIGDREYRGRQAEFRDRSAIQLYFELRRVEFGNALRHTDEELAQAEGQLSEVQCAVIQVEYDRTISYLIPVDAVSGDASGKAPQYIEKLASAEARKLTRDLTEERDDLLARVRDLRSERRRLLALLGTDAQRWQHMQERFHKFGESETAYTREVYVASRKAQLFRNRALIHGLDEGTVVIGQPSVRREERLAVWYDDGVFDSRRDHFLSHHEWELQQTEAGIQMRTEGEYLEADIARLRALEGRYQTMMRQLSIERGSEGRYTVIGPTNARLDLGQSVIEVFDRTYAARVLRDWEQALEEIRTQIEGKRQQVARVRAQTAQLQHRQRTLNGQVQALLTATPLLGPLTSTR